MHRQRTEEEEGFASHVQRYLISSDDDDVLFLYHLRNIVQINKAIYSCVGSSPSSLSLQQQLLFSAIHAENVSCVHIPQHSSETRSLKHETCSNRVKQREYSHKNTHRRVCLVNPSEHLIRPGECVEPLSGARKQ